MHHCRLLLVLLLASALPALVTSEKAQFNVRPNIPDSVEVKHKEVACTFKFAAVGGTNEEWEISLELVGGKYVCNVGRPRASYLFFQSFSASISGKKPITAEVWDNSAALLQNEAYVVDGDVVKNANGWTGVIQRIELSRAAK